MRRRRHYVLPGDRRDLPDHETVTPIMDRLDRDLAWAYCYRRSEPVQLRSLMGIQPYKQMTEFSTPNPMPSACGGKPSIGPMGGAPNESPAPHREKSWLRLCPNLNRLFHRIDLSSKRIHFWALKFRQIRYLIKLAFALYVPKLAGNYYHTIQYLLVHRPRIVKFLGNGV
uniref:Uncharacterized protein n=1 Tax=Romanomermis culicivorax TaxID=13658 RepID=A0A915ISQ9_ROMCU